VSGRTSGWGRRREQSEEATGQKQNEPVSLLDVIAGNFVEVLPTTAKKARVEWLWELYYEKATFLESQVEGVNPLVGFWLLLEAKALSKAKPNRTLGGLSSS